MKKFTKFLGAFALLTMGTLTASAALPLGIASVSPQEGTTTPAADLGSEIVITCSATHDGNYKASPTISIVCPDGETVSPTLKYEYGWSGDTFTADLGSGFYTTHGDGEYKVTADLKGWEFYDYPNGNTINEFSWSYNAGEVSGPQPLPSTMFVYPAAGEYKLADFGGTFSFQSGQGQFAVSVKVTDPTTGEEKDELQNSIDPKVNKIKVEYPNGNVLYYAPVFAANRYNPFTFTIPNDVIKTNAPEGGVLKFTALLNGVKTSSGATLKDYTWDYTLTVPSADGAGEFGLPEGATLWSGYAAYGGTQLTNGETVKQLGSSYEVVLKDVVTNFEGASGGNVTLYRQGADGKYTEEIKSYNLMWDEWTATGSKYLDFSIYPAVTEGGNYRLLFTFNEDTKGSFNGGPVESFPKMSFDLVISAKPDPVKAQYTITPAAGTYNVADMANIITVNFTNAASFVTASGSSDAFTVTAPDGTAVEGVRVNRSVYPNVELLVPAWSQNGEYKLNFNPGYLRGTAENDADLIFEPIEWTYTINGNWVDVPANVTITPAPGEAVQADFTGKVTVKIDGMAYLMNGNPILTINGTEYKYEGGQITDGVSPISFNVPASVFAKGGEFTCEFNQNGATLKTSSFGDVNVETFNWKWTLPEANVIPEGITIVPAAGNVASTDFKDGLTISFNGTQAIAGAENLVLSFNGKELKTSSSMQSGMGGVVMGNSLKFDVKPEDLVEGKNVFNLNLSKATWMGTKYSSDLDFFYIVTLPAEVPALLINGEPAAGETIEVAEGAMISFGEVKEGTSIFYKWDSAEAVVLRAPAEGYTEYTEEFPAQAGKLSYYAENAAGASETKTVTVTLKEGQELPASVLSITPDPNETVSASTTFKNGIAIKFDKGSNQYGDYIQKANTATLTINGVTITSKGNASSGSQATDGTIIFNLPEGFQFNAGKNECVFTRGNAAPIMGTNHIPETFTFYYNADETVSVDGIVIEVSDAEYYTIEGVKVQNPEAGKIYIKVAEGKATKVLVK